MLHTGSIAQSVRSRDESLIPWSPGTMGYFAADLSIFFQTSKHVTDMPVALD